MADEQNFFTDGAAYQRMMGRWSVLAGEVFLGWLAQPKGLRWLDVGCGTGAFTELLVANCAPAEVQGLDPSASQIAYARARQGASLAHFRQGDAQALPFADDSFDVAVMALVISFVPDPAKAVAEMARTVRPGGWIATYMWDGAGGGSPIEPMSAALRSMRIVYTMPPSTAFSRQDKMRALWEQVGLEAIETRLIDVPITYSNFDDFWESNSVVGPTGQAIRGLSPSAIEQLKTYLLGHLPCDREGRISFTAHANAVKGQVPR
jgi:ubiquinone/menaquinone biosynthesis C-methylase UbiE